MLRAPWSNTQCVKSHNGRTPEDTKKALVATAAAKAKLHVEEIRTKKFAIGKKESNSLTENLRHAVANFSAELYTKDVHFLMELIQISEDNEYPAGI